MNIESRVERLNTFIREDRIIRGEWTGTDEQGRETACLLAALAPEVVEADGEWACPANIMPSWFAYLTPWMDDNASEAEWPRMVRRYATCAARWSSLDNAAWRRIEVFALRTAVVEAMRHMTDAQASAILLQVLAWLDAGTPEPERGALQAAALKAQGDAANVASAVTRIADAPLYTAALAADMAGMAAAAQRATADRITDAILSALEAECD